jgi:exopolysaccharide biosynthesis polyprenyl glycosylphosphotransferase
MTAKSYPPTTTATLSPAKVQQSPSVLDMRVKGWRSFLMMSDFIATTLAVFISLLVWSRFALNDYSFEFITNHAYWFIPLPLVWIVLGVINDAYQLRLASRKFKTARAMFLIDLQLILVYTTLYFFGPRNVAPRLFILCFFISAYALTVAFRLGRIVLMQNVSMQRRVIIVGSGQIAGMMTQALNEEASHEYAVIGCITSAYDSSSLPGNIAILGFGQELADVVKQYSISEIIIAYINEIPADIFAGLMECYQQGITVVPMPQLYEEVTGRVPIEHIGERLWALALPLSTRSLFSMANDAIKRILDIVCSLIGLLVFGLILPFVAILIKIDSRGPTFFYQSRVGKGGREFIILKLRTMVADAEKRTGPLWASADDPRVTRVGRFLRKTRIDEFPQLVNVLRGDMSIVGPRPERPEFITLLSEHITFYKSRLVVKPGLTGWAQIRYKYGNTVEDALYKLQFDLYYIRHQSVLLDLLIMARTFMTMLRFQGT